MLCVGSLNSFGATQQRWKRLNNNKIGRNRLNIFGEKNSGALEAAGFERFSQSETASCWPTSSSESLCASPSPPSFNQISSVAVPKPKFEARCEQEVGRDRGEGMSA